MSVSAAYNLKLQVDETLTLGEDLSPDPTIVHSISSSSGTLLSTSTPPATKGWSDTVSLVAGTVTLDLTALARAELTNADFTGLKVQLVKIKAATANTAAVKFDVGASNGYNIFGSATSELSLDADDEVLLKFNDVLPDVAAGAKNIDCTSSDVDAIFDIILVAG